LKCDGTCAETRFRLLAKRTSPFKSAGASVPSTTGSRGVRISGSNAGYTMFRGSVKGTGYPLHSPVSPSFPLLCVTVCDHISSGLYSSTLSLTSALDGVGCERHAPAALLLGKSPDRPIVQETGRTQGPVWTGAENVAPPPPPGIQNPGTPPPPAAK